MSYDNKYSTSKYYHPDETICHNQLYMTNDVNDNNLTLTDLIKNNLILRYCFDKEGSRIIQTLLETASTEEKKAVFQIINPYLLKLISHIFGNYIVQKFLQYGSDQQKKIIANLLSAHVVNLK